MKKKKIGFLYFGRLEQEKGYDAILDMVEMFDPAKELPFSLFIFGSGSLSTRTKQLASTYSDLHYFGWQSLQQIERYKENCEYVLVPSDFLETFGLTALTGLSWELGVIGYRKGGLAQFVPESLDLFGYKGKTTAERLHTLIMGLKDGKTRGGNLKQLEKYLPEAWDKRMQNVFGDHKKILMVSDFNTKFGGIETYIQDAGRRMESTGHMVEYFGIKIPSGTLGNMVKYLGIALSLCNIFAAIQLYIKVRKYQPDVIWYHSVSRWVGWFPLWMTRNSSAKKYMMYHDLGYVYPFPHKLTALNQIKFPFTFRTFVGSTKGIAKLFATGKYLTILLLKRQLLKHIDAHLVPSDFIVDVIHKSYHLPKAKIITFPHFIQD